MIFYYPNCCPTFKSSIDTSLISLEGEGLSRDLNVDISRLLDLIIQPVSSRKIEK